MKQAQLIFDNQLPEEISSLEELIENLATILTENEMVSLPNTLSCLYLDDLEQWVKKSSRKSALLKSQISKYKELQFELCKSMIAEIIEE